MKLKTLVSKIDSTWKIESMRTWFITYSLHAPAAKSVIKSAKKTEGGLPDDLTSCAMTAEFIWNALCNNAKDAATPQNQDTGMDPDSNIQEAFGEDGVYWLKASGGAAHNLIVARQDGYAALLHGWSGVWSVFQHHNKPTYSFNITGNGDGVLNTIKHVLQTPGSYGDVLGAGVWPTTWVIAGPEDIED